MTTQVLERRILTSPLKPLTLRKRKAGKRGKRDDEKPKEGEEKKPDDGNGKEGKGDDDSPDDEGRGDGPGTIEGYGSVFYDESDPGSEYKLWDDPSFCAVERIQRGAFTRAIRDGDDCRALFNHNSDHVLGRTTNGTLRLEEDEKGLKYSNDLPDTTLARDLATSIARGDVNGSSFGFVVEAESWRETEEPDGKRLAVRTIEGVRLLDLGPVTYPAYSSASAGARSGLGSQRALGSVEEARSSYQRWKAREADNVPLAARLAQVRARAVEVSSGQ